MFPASIVILLGMALLISTIGNVVLGRMLFKRFPEDDEQ